MKFDGDSPENCVVLVELMRTTFEPQLSIELRRRTDGTARKYRYSEIHILTQFKHSLKSVDVLALMTASDRSRPRKKVIYRHK